MTDNQHSVRNDQSADDASDPGVPSVAQKEFEDDGLGGDTRGGASRAEDASDPDESDAGDADEGDVSPRRSNDEAEPDTGEPDLVIRVAED